MSSSTRRSRTSSGWWRRCRPRCEPVLAVSLRVAGGGLLAARGSDLGGSPGSTRSERSRYLGWWDTRPLALRRVVLLARDLVVLAFYEQPEVRRRVGYEPDPWIRAVSERRREHWAQEIVDHERLLMARSPLRPSPRSSRPAGRDPACQRTGHRCGVRRRDHRVGCRWCRRGSRAGGVRAVRRGPGRGRASRDGRVHEPHAGHAADALPRRRCRDDARPRPHPVLRGTLRGWLDRGQRRDGVPRVGAGARAVGVRGGTCRGSISTTSTPVSNGFCRCCPPDPDSIGRDQELLKAGAERLGWRVIECRRAHVHCGGCNVCVWGCPTGAKQSALVSYLPRAMSFGASRVDGMSRRPGADERQAGGRGAARAWRATR